MPHSTKRDFYTEYTQEEAAARLGITRERLCELLDRHFFNDGSIRPKELTLTNSELVLLQFWLDSEPNPKVLRMPRRH